MAVFGHSGSHAPQLMHSLVIIVAIGDPVSRLRPPARDAGCPGPRGPPEAANSGISNVFPRRGQTACRSRSGTTVLETEPPAASPPASATGSGRAAEPRGRWAAARRSRASTARGPRVCRCRPRLRRGRATRSEEHTSELQSPYDLVCRLLLEKKKKKKKKEGTSREN